ncbi:MAG: TrkA family potassium uptake protein [Coriobacteriia bacterium]|nr:TrkA family potassium uptake protein [Coriobacteriia bacterium]
MSPFWSTKKEDYIVVIGCGRLGANIANSLSDEGIDVLVVDIDKESFRKLSSSYSGLTLAGDAMDLDVLAEAEIERATAVITVTNYDNTNILVAQIAKNLYGINHVIARLYDTDRDCVYQEFNIDTIAPAVLSMQQIDRLLNTQKA